MKKTLISLFIATITTSIFAQDFTSTKGFVTTEKAQSLVYALPQTVVSLRIEVTKTIVKKGPYADYAYKYLNISNVPMWDSQTWTISDVKITSKSEADPSHYYTITYKDNIENLNRLILQSNKGLVLDFASSWRGITHNETSPTMTDYLFVPPIDDEVYIERIDTTYKTVRTDSTTVRVPVLKKKVIVKTIEDIAKETARELLKTRKRKLKILRGEYDFHPDGAALKVMVDELNRQEEEYLSMFIGQRFTEKHYFTHTFVPTPDMQTKDVCWFSSEEGIKEVKFQGSSAITLYTNREQEPPRGNIPDNTKNLIFIRIPVMTEFTVKHNAVNYASSRLPIYQFGQVQGLPLKQ